MPHWRKICCPIDFSAPARAALEEAARLAVDLDAELILVYVRHRSAPASESPLAPPSPPRSTQDQDQEQFAAWITHAQQLAPARVNSVELSGDAAEKIVSFAAEFGCDVIVMGTHGRTGLKHLAVGSVTEKVIRLSSCPVLVIPHDVQAIS